MTTYRYDGYEAHEGHTRIALFWGDMHIEDIRADKVIATRADLIDVVDRYKADHSQFDVTNYNTGSKFIKAARDYDVLVRNVVDFHTITFEFGGKTYRTRTTNYFSLKMKITKSGGAITRHECHRVQCLVSDRTGDVIGEEKIIGSNTAYDLDGRMLY